MARGTVNTFIGKESKDGTLTLHIGVATSARIRRYCKIENTNVTKFAERVINEALDELEVRQLDKLSKEELIQILLKQEYVQTKIGG